MIEMLQLPTPCVAELATLQRFVPTPGVPFALFRTDMKLTLLGEDSIRLEPTDGPMNIEALTADQGYSPFHMLAGGLAYCTFSVLHSWASHAKINANDLTIDVKWTFADDPHRVGSMELTYQWPSLPADRQKVAQRVAELCPVHKTFIQTPTMTIRHAA